MSNDYYTPSGSPATGSSVASAVMRSEFDAVRSAFDKLVGLSGNGSKLVQVNSGGTALAATNVVWNASNNTLSIQGNANIAGKLVGTSAMLSPLNNSLAADVNLNNTSLFFDGPTVSQGGNGTWFASGSVSVFGVSSDTYLAKLWDGNTVMSTTAVFTDVANRVFSVALSGFITSPNGNIRISVQPQNTNTARMVNNASSGGGGGGGIGSTVSAIRIG